MLQRFLMSALIGLVALLAWQPVAAQDDAPPQTPAELCATNTPATDPESTSFEGAEDVLEEGVDYQAIFCTAAGPVYVDLYEEQTPVTVNNFIFLAQQDYYNNTRFHRVIEAFMVQGGDPTNTGSGGPGYQFEDEFVPDLRFDAPGLLAMANAGPGTNGSQFFITTSQPEHLNDAHTIFGEVLSGYDNVLNIAIRDPQRSFFPGTSLNTVVIVTDPARVDGETETVQPVTQSEVEAVWDALPEDVPAALEDFGPGFSALFEYDDALSGVYSTEDALELAEGTDYAAPLGEWFEAHTQQYAALSHVTSNGCDLTTFPVGAFSYRMDVFEDSDTASAAFNDDLLADVQTAQGFELLTENPLPYPVYSARVPLCDLDDALAVRGLQQVGRYVLTTEVLVTPDLIPESALQQAGVLLEDFPLPLYEDVLWPVLLPETR